MRNIRFLWYNLFDLDTGTLTASSEAEGCPVTYLQDILHKIYWQTTGDMAEWWKRNLGAAYDVTALVIKNHNFRTAGGTHKIQAHDDDVWPGDGLNEDLIITAETIIKFWDTPQNWQWWRCYLDDADNPDGFFKTGRVFLGAYSSPEKNFNNKYRIKHVDPSKKAYSGDGQVYVDEKTKYRQWQYDFEEFSAADKAIFDSIFDYVGQSKPYFISEDADIGATELYYIQNIADWEIEHVFMKNFYNLGIAVQEMR